MNWELLYKMECEENERLRKALSSTNMLLFSQNLEIDRLKKEITLKDDEINHLRLTRYMVAQTISPMGKVSIQA